MTFEKELLEYYILLDELDLEKGNKISIGEQYFPY